MISFWNTFVGTESKHYKLPRSLVKTEINQSIQSIRYMKGRLHRYLIIVINTGQIYIMDCLKVQLLNIEDDEPLQGMTVDYPSVDLHPTHNILLSVSEYGLGRLQ